MVHRKLYTICLGLSTILTHQHALQLPVARQTLYNPNS